MTRIYGNEVHGSMTAKALVDSLSTIGLQASELYTATEIIREMRQENATVFLSFTSNMASSGLREIIAQLCRDKRVDAVVTSIGAVEEDFMKTWKPFEQGSFDADDAALNRHGINRIGNIHVTNAHYEWLEKQLRPFFKEQFEKNEGRPLAPHKLIDALGQKVRDEKSFLYWSTRNRIPVFCPAPTDGAFGMQAYFFKQDCPSFAIDVTADQPALATMVLSAKKTGALLLGGGFAKHHVIGANLLRGGLDYAVYVTTATEYDGSLSGARTKEAVSWGKVKKGAKTAYVQCDASIALPLIMAGTE